MQVIDHYTGTVTGGATIYYYKSADNTSAATRIYSGTGVNIYADENGQPKTATSAQGYSMYNIYSPGRGWMNTWNVANRQPVYRTETDKLTPPQVTLSRADALLTVSGGKSGDLNTFSGYEVQYRERVRAGGAYPDAWTDDTVIPASAGDPVKSHAVSVSDNLHERQYRVRCQGSAEAEYYSDWTVCASTMYIEAADIGAVVVSMPSASELTHVGREGVLVVLNREASLNTTDGHVQLQYQYDSGAWADLSGAVLSADEGYSAHRIPNPSSSGEHVLRLRLRDSVDTTETGEEAVLAFTQPSLNPYTRDISTGDVISNESISHRSELVQMLDLVNAIRAGANLSAAVFADTCGRWENWRRNVNQLYVLLTEAREAYNAPVGTFTEDWPAGMTEAPSYPAASAVNMVRAMIDEF